jgi:hypothetical protein
MRIDDVLQRIQGEFVEMPGLRLTAAQAQRLWGLERDVCDALLGALVDAKFLAQTRADNLPRQPYRSARFLVPGRMAPAARLRSGVEDASLQPPDPDHFSSTRTGVTRAISHFPSRLTICS